MTVNKQSTEDQILKAAEKIFLEKGFKTSKISDIAKEAGVNNALINYYFRSKENLFNKVLHDKVALLANSLSLAADQETSFLQIIQDMVEAQFEFFKANTSLPRFILMEIIPDDSRVEVFRENIIPIILNASMQLNDKLQQEIKAGHIRNVSMFELLYTITAVNVFCFIVKPVIMGASVDSLAIQFSEILNDRKGRNVEIIMSYLKNITKP
ncbi:TetR/AcrR family transcriptional regulator [Bacteroidales bacterium OttesenSCG-928-B11]|nr:TetR/AcrR family transcriptional regulator [Bacteroidales bacterium OttesenSCG-928-C03]MDL2311443.1 TetR/AcrR family transcriptional regulator [Bacteroidales bacterium OttesenSCG-928-B11]